MCAGRVRPIMCLLMWVALPYAAAGLVILVWRRCDRDRARAGRDDRPKHAAAATTTVPPSASGSAASSSCIPGPRRWSALLCCIAALARCVAPARHLAVTRLVHARSLPCSTSAGPTSCPGAGRRSSAEPGTVPASNASRRCHGRRSGSDPGVASASSSGPRSASGGSPGSGRGAWARTSSYTRRVPSPSSPERSRRSTACAAT
jgi:hypothetical protein